MIFETIVQMVSGLASPVIFVPSLAIGWFARRWWQVTFGAVVVAVLSEAELMLIELPGATPVWTREPLVLVPSLIWCLAGFWVHAWHRRASRNRRTGPINVLPVVAGMVFGGLAVGALALGVGLLYLYTDTLEFHTVRIGQADGSSGYETVFFQYLFPGLLLGQFAGGLLGRLFGRPIV
jgi:hypothetical protein